MLSPITRPKLLLTFLKRSMSMNMHGGAVGLAFARAGDGAVEAIHEQLAVGQAGQAVMHRVVDQPLMRALQIGHVAHQPVQRSSRAFSLGAACARRSYQR